jgi:adenine/guanine phosphoribosyltransferase-like PRPP-binding protein
VIYHGDKRDLSDLPEVVARAAETLRPHRDSFDLIAVMGVSGLLVGPPLAVDLEKPILVIRKDEDVNAAYRHDRFVGWHRPRRVSATQASPVHARALWVDDFIASGDTRLRVAKLLLERGARMEMMYLYRDNELAPPPPITRGTAPRYDYGGISRSYDENVIPF